MTIPHIIHFVWVGGNDYSELAQRCIKSWEMYCPNYEIVRWDESNFDINSNIFVKEAYEAKKWAFVSDYIRLYVLYNYGGVYMDADVELLKNIDEIVDDNDAFTGYQNNTIPAGIMGANKDNIWIKSLLDFYSDKHFFREDGSYADETNSEIIARISMKKFNFKLGDDKIIDGGVKLYPEIYFFPYKKNMFIRDPLKINLQYKINKDKTYCIHHSAGSWEPKNGITALAKAVARLILPQKIYQGIQTGLVDTNGRLRK